MLNGFDDKLNDLPSRIDDYGYFVGPHYETGRHLATYLSVTDYDTATITLTNIFSTYSKFRKEIYPQHGQHRRTRNA
jgi:hypothetical protein